MKRAALWTCVLLLLAAAAFAPRATSEAGRGLVPRLLGPISGTVADWLWLRVEAARRAGRHDLVLARGELALRLDPGATRGWEFLATHQALVLGSTTREDDPKRRAAWLKSGLDTARRGEAVAREPEALAFLRGIVLQTHAEFDEWTSWPGGTRGLWLATADAYAAAAELGHPEGASMAAAALARSGGGAGTGAD